MKKQSAHNKYPGLILNPPADSSVLLSLQRAYPKLPKDFIEFLSMNNGGEGTLSERYLILWRAEDLVDFNKAYAVERFSPDTFIFGTDGGDEGFGFKFDEFGTVVVSVPFIGMGLDASKTLAASFTEFLGRSFQ